MFKAIIGFIKDLWSSIAKKEYQDAEIREEQEQVIKHEQHKTAAAKKTDSQLDIDNNAMLDRMRKSGH